MWLHDGDNRRVKLTCCRMTLKDDQSAPGTFTAKDRRPNLPRKQAQVNYAAGCPKGGMERSVANATGLLSVGEAAVVARRRISKRARAGIQMSDSTVKQRLSAAPPACRKRRAGDRRRHQLWRRRRILWRIYRRSSIAYSSTGRCCENAGLRFEDSAGSFNNTKVNAGVDGGAQRSQRATRIESTPTAAEPEDWK